METLRVNEISAKTDKKNDNPARTPKSYNNSRGPGPSANRYQSGSSFNSRVDNYSGGTNTGGGRYSGTSYNYSSAPFSNKPKDSVHFNHNPASNQDIIQSRSQPSASPLASDGRESRGITSSSHRTLECDLYSASALVIVHLSL